MESLYASRTVQRFGKWVVSLLAASFTAAAIMLGRVTYGWFESRASKYTVASAIAQHASEVAEVKRQASHGASLADENARQLVHLWEWEIAAQAELVVYRSYGQAAVDPVRRGRMIEQSKRFYQREWEIQRAKHANDLAEAARQTMLAEWSGR